LKRDSGAKGQPLAPAYAGSQWKDGLPWRCVLRWRSGSLTIFMVTHVVFNFPAAMMELIEIVRG